MFRKTLLTVQMMGLLAFVLVLQEANAADRIRETAIEKTLLKPQLYTADGVKTEDSLIRFAFDWSRSSATEKLLIANLIATKPPEQPETSLVFLLEALQTACVPEKSEGEKRYIWDETGFLKKKKYMPSAMPDGEEIKIVVQGCIEELIAEKENLIEKVRNAYSEVRSALEKEKRAGREQAEWDIDYQKRLRLILASCGDVETPDLIKMYREEKDPYLRINVLVAITAKPTKEKKDFLVDVLRRDRTELTYYCEVTPSNKRRVVTNAEVFVCKFAAFLALQEMNALPNDFKIFDLKKFVVIPEEETVSNKVTFLPSSMKIRKVGKGKVLRLSGTKK